MKKKNMIIKHNNINYQSLGIYEDNNDGILMYFPDDFELEANLNFLLEQDYAIKGLVIGYMAQKLKEEVNEDFILLFNEKTFKLMSHYIEDVMRYHDSYFEEFLLNEKFLDLVFGKYSTYGEIGLPINKDEDNGPYIYSDGSELILPNGIDYSSISENIFIKKEYYSEFINSTNEILKIFK